MVALEYLGNQYSRKIGKRARNEVKRRIGEQESQREEIMLDRKR